MVSKRALLRLVEELPEELPEPLASEAERALERLRDLTQGDPVLRALLEAPEDDEIETPEEAVAVQEALEEVAKGHVTPWEEVRRELNLDV